MSVGVVVATYGDWRFDDPRTLRALASAEAQEDDPVVVYQYGETLADARNRGAERVGTDYVVFLDGDDELAPGYTRAMANAVGEQHQLYQPSTVGVRDGVTEGEPNLIPTANLFHRNYLVIGTMVEAESFFKVGGFSEWDALEDWELWIRITKNGGEVTQVPDAVYRVHINDGGRNIAAHNAVYMQIRALHG